MLMCFFYLGGDKTEDGYNNTFIMTAQSEHLHVQTAAPPLPPSNLGIMATTCNSVQLSWDPPKERGTDIIGKTFIMQFMYY